MASTDQGSLLIRATHQKIFSSSIFWESAWKLLYLLVVSSLLYASFSNWGYDDPYITYRYASNLAHGLGFVYNSGERVLSTTTPLFTLLLAFLSYIWFDLPHLANFLGAFCVAAGALFLWDMAQTWRTPLVGWTSLLLYPLSPLLITTLGSETPLYLMFCLAAIAFYARRSLLLAALCAASAFLARPDGILVAITLTLAYFIGFGGSKKKSIYLLPWKAIAVYLVVVISWVIFSWGYFGSPLPVTLAAKQHQGSMAISQRFAPGFISLVKGYARYWPYWIEAALAFLGLIAFLVPSFWNRFKYWLLPLSWTALYFAAYTLLGVSRYFWYYAPLIPGFVILIGLGISVIGSHFPGHSTKGVRHPAKEILRPAKLIAILVAIIILTTLTIFQIRQLHLVQRQPDLRLLVYKKVGQWLNANTPPDASVGMLEVGIIGYYAQRQIVDFAGLIQPEVTAQIKRNTTYGDTAQWAIEHYHPEYLVLHSGVFPSLEVGYVSQHCHVIQSFPGKANAYTSTLDIYICQ